MLRTFAMIALVGLACGGEPPGPGGGSGRRVLFIGNSLTNTNDLPAMVRVLAESAGTPFVTAMIAPGGVSLEDHWGDADTRATATSGRWDVVVLQQGPSALPSSRANLIEWTVRWSAAIRAAGATPVVYMPWPEAFRRSAFDSVSANYRAAAEAADALLVPGGDAWQAAWRRDPSLALYGPDRFHPSRLGTYVVAVATWARLTGRPASEAPIGLDLVGGAFEPGADAAGVVKAAVAEVLQ